MRILLLNPFHGGSHAAVAEGYARHSRHEVTLLTLPIDGGWRWRMRGAAVTLARLARPLLREADLLLATDMLDVATFVGLLAVEGLSVPPVALYFHENQLTYPLPTGRARDLSFGWINYTSALAAQRLLFNSDFHRQSFLAALPDLLGRFHDYRERETVAQIGAKSQVLYPGIDLARLNVPQPATDDGPAVILWNSRWEYDKQPAAFFAALEVLAARGVAFRLIVLGEHIDPNAAEFVAARERWVGHILHWGYVPSVQEYAALLRRADIVVSTAIQEFFGIGVLEAIYCGCVPVLPRRLAYPELLPPQYHATCLYDRPATLVDRLQAVIANIAQLQQLPWVAVAAPYAWPTIAPSYDAVLQNITGAR